MSETEEAKTTLHQARLSISFELFVEMLKGEGQRRTFTVEGALPPDARLVRYYTPPSAILGDERVICLVFESESFAPVKEGEMLPELPPVLCKTVFEQ